MHPQRGVIIAGLRQSSQPLQIFRFTLAASRWIQRDHPCPGQRFPRGNITQNQTIVVCKPER